MVRLFLANLRSISFEAMTNKFKRNSANTLRSNMKHQEKLSDEEARFNEERLWPIEGDYGSLLTQFRKFEQWLMETDWIIENRKSKEEIRSYKTTLIYRDSAENLVGLTRAGLVCIRNMQLANGGEMDDDHMSQLHADTDLYKVVIRYKLERDVNVDLVLTGTIPDCLIWTNKHLSKRVATLGDLPFDMVYDGFLINNEPIVAGVELVDFPKGIINN